jgi:hypothetical protein
MGDKGGVRPNSFDRSRPIFATVDHNAATLEGDQQRAVASMVTVARLDVPAGPRNRSFIVEYTVAAQPAACFADPTWMRAAPTSV